MCLPKSMILSLSLLSCVLALAAAGCESPTPAEPEEVQISPFSIAASITGSTPEEVGRAIYQEIHTIDDIEARGWAGDWVVVGFRSLEEGDDPFIRALHFPNGAILLEICNRSHVAESMSHGGHHGVAFPCEIAVIPTPGGGVEVIILNPESIFGVYFGDLTSTDYSLMAGHLVSIRNEMEQLVASALVGFNAVYPLEDIGPSWDAEEWEEIRQQEYSTFFEIPIPTEHRGSDEDRLAYKDSFVSTLLQTATTPASEQIGADVADLSTSDWRSARTFPLNFPGDSGVKVVEMWSDTYMDEIELAGSYHLPALPFAVGSWVEGDTVRVNLLEPEFIFGVFYSDISEQRMQALNSTGNTVRQDLILIVEEAIANFQAPPQ